MLAAGKRVSAGGAAAWLALGALSCATLADTGGGDVALPNAGIGPFRELERVELGNSRTAPYALKDDDDYPRDASVIDADGDPATLEVHGYVARTAVPEGEEADPADPANEIVRFVAADGRSFGRQFETVLLPEREWEGGEVGQPCAVRMDGEIWLYYAAAGGIGLARSVDGASFQPLSAAVLAPRADGWEQGVAPASPAVVRLPDGSLRMFYQVALEEGRAAIGEAASVDGEQWQRLGAEPALVPRPSGLAAGEVYDDESVEAPYAAVGVSARGRTALRLYYSAVDSMDRRTVALAARDGVDGPFTRAAAPVFGTSGGLGPTEPWVVQFPGFALLFVTQLAGKTEAQSYPAVAVGVAPATAVLPPPISD